MLVFQSKALDAYASERPFAFVTTTYDVGLPSQPVESDESQDLSYRQEDILSLSECTKFKGIAIALI